MSSREVEGSTPRTHRGMAEVPDRIDLRTHRDLQSWAFNRPTRYVILALVAAVCVAGLFNLFGQRPSTATAENAKATLELTSPERVRGGLLFQARFTITAHEALTHVVLQLAPGWSEGMQMNTIEPSPIAEGSRDGKLVLELGHVPKGSKYILFIQLQVNPTNVGRRSQDVAIYDGETLVSTIDRTITIFP